MKNPLVTGHEARDIQKQVAKLLRDLGNPEPPLSLDVVRDRLDLDRQYYDSSDQSFVRETVHAIKVAGKQILKRPTLLWDVIRTSDLRALWLPDSKRILIDQELPLLKHRWAEGHEIGHAITPWHAEYLMGDAEAELSPACFATIEAEANYACGQLLFLQDRFVEEMMSMPLSIDSVKRLKEEFGNTYTSTLWRMIEEYRGSKPVVGIVSVHPVHLNNEFNPDDPCRYVIQSPRFRDLFASVTEVELFGTLQSYCNSRKGGPLGEADVVLSDVNGERYEFHFETFFFHYQALSLGVCQRKLNKSALIRRQSAG
ncbi:MAG: DUF955 domain-containing protein [Planctomycetota bacterium]|nr:MAG: DUF955 domain-containing protein [Planctomycetota bacterium]REK28402.1 MAG: DUF955 domain-containing protein [Planctomycetota bacterium]REK48418.1 MAG: DUF955 domain-containing protein [Planctomycetota bacterium]